MTVFFALIAGLFAGAFAISCVVIYLNLRNLKEFNAERKRWINKALVRDGQATIFSAADIDPVQEKEETEPSKPFSLISPLRRSHAKVNESIKREQKNNLPEGVKIRIGQAVEDVKSVA